MSGIIKPGLGPLHDLIASRLDPLAIELHAKHGCGVILIGAIPLANVTHIAFSSDRFTLENDIKRLSEFYRNNAHRYQTDAVAAHLRKAGGVN